MQVERRQPAWPSYPCNKEEKENLDGEQDKKPAVFLSFPFFIDFRFSCWSDPLSFFLNALLYSYFFKM
jgi:hypothetical protein